MKKEREGEGEKVKMDMEMEMKDKDRFSREFVAMEVEASQIFLARMDGTLHLLTHPIFIITLKNKNKNK